MRAEKQKISTRFTLSDFHFFISWTSQQSVAVHSVDVTEINASNGENPSERNRWTIEVQCWSTKISIEADRREKRKQFENDWCDDEPLEIWFAKISSLTQPIELRLGHLFFYPIIFFVAYQKNLRCWTRRKRFHVENSWPIPQVWIFWLPNTFVNCPIQLLPM